MVTKPAPLLTAAHPAAAEVIAVKAPARAASTAAVSAATASGPARFEGRCNLGAVTSAPEEGGGGGGSAGRRSRREVNRPQEQAQHVARIDATTFAI